MYVGVYLYIYLWTTCVSGAYRGQKKVSNPLELEIQIDVSPQVDGKNQTRVLCTSNKCT